jgi:hypothetical protein
MNNLYLILNIIEAIYILYMMVYFKTKYSLHLSTESITKTYDILRHPINTGKYESKICPLGHLIGYLLPIWILIRVMYRYSKEIKILNIIIWFCVFVLSFIMNINAFIYLIPVFLVEFYLFYSIPKIKII